MKPDYRRQLVLTVFLVLLGNVLCTLFDHWIYRNIAFFLCGLLWIFHPVMAGSSVPTKRELNLIRFWGGGILILISIFTRVHY